MTSAFKIARNSASDFGSHHSLLKPSCLSTFGPPTGVPPPPAAQATPSYLAPTLASPLSHDQLGFHPSMLFNAQLALQVQAAAMAAALGASSSSASGSTMTPSIFSRASPPSSVGASSVTGSHHNGDSGTLHSMEKMVAGINGNASD